MSSTKEQAPLFRVGDRVSLLYGIRRTLARVIEDRGPLGVHGRRLYRVCLDLGQDEATSIEIREEDLKAESAPEKVTWGAGGAMAVHRTLSYFGQEEDAHGMPNPWYHYLVVASPGPKAGSGVASIISLSAARRSGMAQSPSHTIVAKEGGPEAAFSKAEEYLDGRHPELKKIVSETKS